MLALPDVAELVGDEIVRRVGIAHEDRPPERVAVVAPEARDAEEPGSDADPDAIDPYGLGIEIERVETGFRAREGAGEVGVRHSRWARAP